MAVLKKDDLFDVLGQKNISRRLEIWLWLTLRKFGANFPPQSLGGHASRLLMAKFIRSANIDVAALLIAMDFSIVPDEQLKWIESSDRQTEWLKQKLSLKLFNFTIDRNEYLNDKEYILAEIDLLEMDLSEKKRLLREVANEWMVQLRSDASFKWFQSDDEGVRCQMAYEYMLANVIGFEKITASIGARSALSFQGLMMLFDKFYSSDAEKKLCLEKVKSRYAQYKYRAKHTGKKQKNLLLSYETLQKLDSLSAKYSLSKNQLVDILIRTEEQNGLYIPLVLKRNDLL